MTLLDLIDHIIVIAPDLEQGMDHAEAVLGVRPVRAGRHPAFGTHNALLSLGEGTYFEVIAPDPGLPTPDRGVLWGLDDISEPRLATWVMRTEDMKAVLSGAQGVGLGPPKAGFRDNPDGSRIEWVATDPFPFPLQGAVPFLIAWGESTHPSSVLPPGGELLNLRLEHPEPDAVQAAYARLGIEMDVSRANQPGFVATLHTLHGVVELR